MNLLRQTIRRIILEDLGEKVFARNAPVGHPHRGEEWNTEEEDDLMYYLDSYINGNTTGPLPDDFDEIYLKYASDPRYNDVLKTHPAETTLYRGMLVPRGLLEGQIFGINDEDGVTPNGTVEPNTTYTDLNDTEYEHYMWRPSANIALSSWTTDHTTAVEFSTGDETEQSSNAEIPVIFIASTGGSNEGKFLDFRPLYEYDWWKHKKHEQEIAGMGFLELDKIYVGDF